MRRRGPGALALGLVLAATLATPARANTQQVVEIDPGVVPIIGPDVAIVPIARQIQALDNASTRIEDAGEVTLRFAADVFFAFDSATLTPEADAFLRDQVAPQLAEQAQGPVKVDGHTDAIGSDAYNDGLSQQRADAVATVLGEVQPQLDVSAEGFGERQPVAVETDEDDNDLPANRQRNRRVEIRFPGTGELAAAPAPGALPDPAAAPTEAP